MPLFDEDGVLNLEAAAADVRDTASIQNTTANAQTLDRITVAALIDIAASLRGIAQAVNFTPRWVIGDGALDADVVGAGALPIFVPGDQSERIDGPDGPTIVEPEREPGKDEEGYDLDEPDLVFAVGDWATNDEHPEVAPLQVTAVGVSEGEEWAELGGVRIFTKYLTLVDKEAYDAERARELEEAPDPRDQVIRDLDSDFDTQVPFPGQSVSPAALCGAEHPAKGLCNRKPHTSADGKVKGKHRNDAFSWKDQG